MKTTGDDPLAGLEAIDWSRLHHAYGPADDVPGQLRALSSPDPDVRRRAHHELRGNVFHQGTRWQVSHHVVPFLAALADDPATPDRPLVVALLRLVAIGYLDDEDLPFAPEREFAVVEGLTDADVAMTVRWLYGEGDADGGTEHDDVYNATAWLWARDAYRAAAAISDRFAAWTADPDPVIAAHAAELLAWFPATDDTVATLLAVPATAESAVARASANLTLGYIAPADAKADEHLAGLLTADPYAVRLTAAVALALRLGDRLPKPARRVLSDAPEHAEEIDPRAFPIPWSRPLGGFATLARHELDIPPAAR